MPFGGIEEDGEVLLKGKGMTSIQLDEFEKVFKYGSINTAIEQETYRAPSIPGVVLLRLIAFDDRPD
jgi:predicted nucleotidyltransferase